MANDYQGFSGSRARRREPESTLPIVAQYGVSLGLVVAATFLAFVANSVVPAPGLTLIFVLPVVITGAAFGLGPSVATTLLGVLAFDFFFTEPIYTLQMTDPSEFWAASLLLVTAAIVSTVAWQSRRYAADAQRSAAQEEELRCLAHSVIDGASHNQIVEGAVTALNKIFGGPSLILTQVSDQVRLVAAAGGAIASEHDIRSAERALESGVPMRANTYPTEQSSFDMWPVDTAIPPRYVVGVDFRRAENGRPADADRLVEIVAGYLVASLATAG